MWVAKLPDSPAWHFIKGPIVQIGRAPDLAIVVSSDKSVSRVHAQLEIETSPTGQQQLRLRDMGSRFGTNLNGVLIKPNESALVEGSEAMVEVGGAGTTILLQQRRLSLCMSSMLKKDKDRVKAAARALQGTITAQADGASHVVIERMNATAKVLTALTQGTPLVTPQWMDFALMDRALVPVPEEAAFFPPAAAELGLCPAGRSRSNALSQLTVIVLDPSDLAYLPILSGCGAAVLRAYDMPWDAFLHSLATTTAPPRESVVAVFFDENQQQEAPADLMQQIRGHVQAQAAVSWLTVGQLAKAVFTLCTPLLYLAAPRCRLTQGGAGVSQSQAAGGGGGGYLSQVRMAAFSQQQALPLPLPLPLPPPTSVSAAPAPLRKCAPPTPIPTPAPAPPSSPVWASAARKRGRGTPEEVQGGGGVEEMSVMPASKRRCDPCAPSSAAFTPSALKVSLADDWDDVPVPSIPAPVPASAPVLAPAFISAPVTAVPMKAVAVAQPISKPSPPPSAAAIATASAAVFPAPAPARAPAVPSPSSSSSSSSSSSAHVPVSASSSATSATVSAAAKQHKPSPVSAPVTVPAVPVSVPRPPHPHSTSSSADDGEGDGDGDWVTVEHNSLHHHHQMKQQRTTEGEEQGGGEGEEEEEVEGVQPEVEERALLVRHSVLTSSSTSSSSSSSSAGIGGAAVGGAGKGMRDVRCFVKNSTRARAGRQVLTLGSMDRVLPRESERELQLRLDFEALQAVEDQARSMMDEGSAATRKGRKR